MIYTEKTGVDSGYDLEIKADPSISATNITLCSVCGGKGSVHSTLGLDVCPRCSGSGRIVTINNMGDFGIINLSDDHGLSITAPFEILDQALTEKTEKRLSQIEWNTKLSFIKALGDIEQDTGLTFVQIFDIIKDCNSFADVSHKVSAAMEGIVTEQMKKDLIKKLAE